jgi:hypothetical protein
MRAEDFSDWLSAIAGMSAEQRRQGLQALTKGDGEAGASGEGIRCAMGVLVNALNVRPQLLQRNRNSPFERPQPTISRPAQWGQPWLSTRSTLAVP